MKIIRYVFPTTAPVLETEELDGIDDTEFVDVGLEITQKKPELIDILVHCIPYHIGRVHWQISNVFTVGWLIRRITHENKLPNRLIAYIKVNGRNKALLSTTTFGEIEEMLGYQLGHIDLYLDKNI